MNHRAYGIGRCLMAVTMLAAVMWHGAIVADDEVITEEPPGAMGERQPHLVDLGSNFDTNLFDRQGNSWVIRGGGGVIRMQVQGGGIQVQGAEPRQGESPALLRARSAGKKRLERIDAACSLSAEQRRRLELALESDSRRFAAEIDTIRSRYVGRQINMNDQAGQKEWHAFQQDVQRCREQLRRLYSEASLFTSVLRTTLDERQLTVLLDEQTARRSYHWRTLVAETLARLDDTLALSEPQHAAIEKLLLDREPALRIDADTTSINDSNLRRQLVFMVLAEVDAKKLKAVVSERQWKTLGNLTSQGRAMRSWIEAQGVLEPSGK
jgi:hypothetical protein